MTVLLLLLLLWCGTASANYCYTTGCGGVTPECACVGAGWLTSCEANTCQLTSLGIAIVVVLVVLTLVLLILCCCCVLCCCRRPSCCKPSADPIVYHQPPMVYQQHVRL